MTRNRRKFQHGRVKPTKTVRALMENAIPVGGPSYSQAHWTNRRARVFRLAIDVAEPVEWRPDYLAENLGGRSPQNTLFFVDTGFVTTEIDFRVWDGVLRRKVAITPQIWGELGPWLRTPFWNQQLRELLLESESGKVPNVEHLAVDRTLIDHAYDYYLALLCCRKNLWKQVEADFLAANGREPTDAELLRLLQARAGDYFDVAKKGWEGRGKPNLFADEELVVSAVLTAVLRGVEVVILTRDNDVQRQFVEMAGLLLGHYESMLFADYVDEHRAEFGDAVVPRELAGPGHNRRASSVLGSNEGAGFTFRRSLLSKHLPPMFIPVVVNCMLFGGNDSQRKLSTLSFCGETRMREILKLKSLERRPNTTKFGEYNCYVTGAADGDLLTFVCIKDVLVELDGVKMTGADYVHATGDRVKSTHFHY